MGASIQADRVEENRASTSSARAEGPELLEWTALSVPLGAVDPLALALASGGLTAFLQRADAGWAVAGVGVEHELCAHRATDVADVLEACSARGAVTMLDGPPPPAGPWFGGLAFDPHRRSSPEWAGFPAARWIVPSLLFWHSGAGTWVTAFSRGPESELRARIERARGSAAVATGSGPPVRELEGDRAGWRALVEKALAAIQAQSFEKVVVARAIEVGTEGSAIDAAGAVAALRTRYPSCLSFYLRGRDGSAFIGATPELLCRIQGPDLESEALAGSAPPAQAERLRTSDKDLREHRLVVEGIVEALEPLGERIVVGPTPSLRMLPNVAHLWTSVHARLLPHVGPSAVVRALHPTPAVGGRPRRAALSFLAEHESFDRGWYAGAIGWMGQATAELYVALRSALVTGRSARVFVGAGVVAGSTADAEWLETEAKSRPMLEALGGQNG